MPLKYLGKLFSLRKGVSGLTTFPLFIMILIFFISNFIMGLFTSARFSVSLGSDSRSNRESKFLLLACRKLWENFALVYFLETFDGRPSDDSEQRAILQPSPNFTQPRPLSSNLTNQTQHQLIPPTSPLPLYDLLTPFLKLQI